jgi:serine/threonine-protein kinase
MPIETPEDLFHALRDGGLLPAERLAALARDAAPLGPDLPAVCRRLADRGPLTSYQLKKVVAGRAEDLRLGPYVLADKLGKGGMGRVYRAWHGKTGRQVALKVVHPNLVASPTVRGRYVREAETAAALRHRNLVRLEEAGEDGGRYYLAMEFVDGLDLSKLLREYPQLEVEEACEYARQAAVGLHHAHKAGFVHRDVKPSNIIVAGERHVPQATEPAVVKVTDLGLVRAVGLADAAEDLTRDGTVVGTPDYMAPEQAKNSSTVDHRADLYSLGCTLYFLLAGRAPFPDGTAVEKLLRHQLDAPPPVQDLRPEVPDVLATVVARLMAKAPGDRFPSAAAAAAALAPLAVYPRGAKPVAIRPRPARAVPAPDSVNTPSRPGSSTHAATPAPTRTPPARRPAPPPPLVPQPVAASDRTPRPLALPDPGGDSPFAVLNDSGADHPFAAPPPAFSRRVWAAVIGAVAAVVVVGVWAVGRPGRPAPPGPPDPADPPKAARPAPPARPHPPAALVADGATLVAVAHPGAFLRDRNGPLAKGVGPGRLAGWADRLEKATALPLGRTDRLVVSFPADAPGHYLAAAEGDFLSPKFADQLDNDFATFSPLPKTERGLRRYRAAGGEVGLLTPPAAAPVYAVASGPGLVDQLGPRLLGPRPGTAGHLDPRLLAAVSPPAGSPPPPLAAAATGDWRPPGTDNRTLKDYGIDFLTVRVRATDRLEVEVTATGPVEKRVRSGLSSVGRRFREHSPAWGPMVYEVLTHKEAIGGAVEKGYQVTVRVAWSPEHWSDFLEACFPP